MKIYTHYIIEMERMFTVSIAILVVYFIVRVIDIKFICKKNVVIKEIIKESLLVYLSSIIGIYVYDNVINKAVAEKYTNVYVENPNF